MENNNETEFNNLEFIQDNKSAKLKKTIFGIAILAVIFVIVYIVSTSFSSSNENETATTQETEEFMDLESDPFFQEMAPTKDNEQQNNNNQVNPRNDRPEPFNTVVDDYAEEPNPADDDPLDYLKKEELFKEPEPIVQPSVTEEVDILQHDSDTIKPNHNQHSSVVTSLPAQNSNLTVERKYYIQTGTFFKYKPNEQYLKKIMALELTYHVDTYISHEKEVTRVLIGPFDTRDEAKVQLQSVKEGIEKGAYILNTRLH